MPAHRLQCGAPGSTAPALPPDSPGLPGHISSDKEMQNKVMRTSRVQLSSPLGSLYRKVYEDL